MKKNIIRTTVILGLLTFGALSASAAEACDKCTEKQVLQQFSQETADLTTALKVKNFQLRELYSYDGLDVHKVNQLEEEIKDLKEKINLSANKLGVSPCNRL